MKRHQREVPPLLALLTAAFTLAWAAWKFLAA